MLVTLTLAAGLAVIVLAVFAILRRVEVRLTLLGAAVSLGILSGDLSTIIKTFFTTFADEKFVVPICSAMGFAYVLRHTQCDQHLIHLLVQPLRRLHVILVPGTVCVGFLVNIPVISQTSTAVAIGSVVVPLLRAARVSPLTVGAALLLGSSVGGELLNPGAPELRTIITETEKASTALGLEPLILNAQTCVFRILPLNMVQLFVATAVFWITSLRREARRIKEADQTIEDSKVNVPISDTQSPQYRVRLIQAVVPLVPLLLLFISGPPLELLRVPREWLAGPDQPDKVSGRLVGAAMIVGVVVAALTAPRQAWGSVTAFFEGAGYAFAHVISLIVTASCFGTAVRQIGVGELFGDFVRRLPGLLVPSAGLLPLGFAAISGSGMAATQSLFGFFAEPSLRQGIDPAHVGAVVSLAAAAGRTMSPVAAVTLMSALLTGTNPFDLARRVALPLLTATTVTVLVALFWQPAL